MIASCSRRTWRAFSSSSNNQLLCRAKARELTFDKTPGTSKVGCARKHMTRRSVLSMNCNAGRRRPTTNSISDIRIAANNVDCGSRNQLKAIGNEVVKPPARRRWQPHKPGKPRSSMGQDWGCFVLLTNVPRYLEVTVSPALYCTVHVCWTTG